MAKKRRSTEDIIMDFAYNAELPVVESVHRVIGSIIARRQPAQQKLVKVRSARVVKVDGGDSDATSNRE